MDNLEKIIRPIVEGQIRGFLKEHPAIVKAVDWYPQRANKAVTFTNSLAKRIVRDLVCPTQRARLAAAVLPLPSERQSSIARGTTYCADGGLVGTIADESAPSRALLPPVMWRNVA